MNLPRRLDPCPGKTAAHPAPLQPGLAHRPPQWPSSRIEVYPTVLLALPDAALAEAAAEVERTRTQLAV